MNRADRLAAQRRRPAPPEPASTRRRLMAILAGVAAIATVLTLVFALSGGGGTPALVGKPQAAAVTIARKAGLKPNIIPNPDQKACAQGVTPKIITQYPAAGDPLPKDKALQLVADCRG